MTRTLLLAAALSLGSACATHQIRADARRAWLDITLDEPVQLERVLDFLDRCDPATVSTRKGDMEVRPPSVDDALAWLDAYRRENRHWIDEVVAANDRFDAADLPATTVDELSRQLTELVLEMGPPATELEAWPQGANPYPWPAEDGELRTSFFGLYLQAGRLCPYAEQPLEGCMTAHQGHDVPLGWLLAARLLHQDPKLADTVTRPAELTALEALKP